MKALVTGSSGLVGSATCEYFREKGWEVVGIDSNMRSYFFGTPRKEVEYGIDIRDEKAIDKLFLEHEFDAIIHAAAQPSHDWAKKEPLTDFDINARGTLILLEATRKYCPEAVFVYVSTDKVYGEHMVRETTELKTRYHSGQPYDESLPLDYTKRSLFGCSKLAGDLYVQEYGRYFGMKTACFRPGCITGKNHEGAEEHGFLAYVAKCCREDIPYTIYGHKGKQVRDIIHAADLASAFYQFVLNPKVAAVYNIGGGPERSISVMEALAELMEPYKPLPEIKLVEEPRSGDRQWDVHDVSKFRTDYPDWEYEYSLNDIIEELCQ